MSSSSCVTLPSSSRPSPRRPPSPNPVGWFVGCDCPGPSPHRLSNHSQTRTVHSVYLYHHIFPPALLKPTFDPTEPDDPTRLKPTPPETHPPPSQSRTLSAWTSVRVMMTRMRTFRWLASVAFGSILRRTPTSPARSVNDFDLLMVFCDLFRLFNESFTNV